MTTPPRPPAPPRTVLVVDDEPALRRVLERLLARLGYRVLSAGSAEAAYELLGRERPDALLLYVRLPTMSGLALYLLIVHRLLALKGRIAIMTGDAEEAEVRTWIEHHRCPVIRKPFNVQEVSDWLREVERLAAEQQRGEAEA